MKYSKLMVIMHVIFSAIILSQITAADRALEREIQQVKTMHSNNSRLDRTRDVNTDRNNNNKEELDRNSTGTNRR